MSWCPDFEFRGTQVKAGLAPVIDAAVAVEAAAKYSKSTAGVDYVVAVVDGRMDGGHSFSPNLSKRTKAEVEAWANSTAQIVCASPDVDGIQIDLEPVEPPYVTRLVQFLAQLSAELRTSTSCVTDTHPQGRSVSAFMMSEAATAAVFDALSPNGYVTVSGYDLSSSPLGTPSTVAEYGTRLGGVLDTITATAKHNNGSFVLGIPAAASCHEFHLYLPINGTAVHGHTQLEYLQQALKVIDAKGLYTNPNYLGLALWGFSSEMAYPPHSENKFSPSNPFVSEKEEKYLKTHLKSDDITTPFVDLTPAPGMPKGYKYAFMVPVLLPSPGGALLAFSEAHMLIYKTNSSHEYQRSWSRLSDGDDGWIDIVARRSENNGSSWGPLQVLCRNSTGSQEHGPDVHACEQPSPVADTATGQLHLLLSVDNWWHRIVSSSDDGRSWTPWAQARDLDASLRRPGWGAVFPGLPGPGIQLRPPSPHAGRLVICSSAYTSGGALNPDGSIAKLGDSGSRHSYAIISDNNGKSWSLGELVGPVHTTECSFAQSFSEEGELYMYTRIFDAKFVGKGTPNRGIARSTDGGLSFTNATLIGTGLPNDAPDCEGSMISVPHAPHLGSAGTCWFVSAPRPPDGSGHERNHVTVRAGCGSAPSPTLWGPPILVDPGNSSYSSLTFVGGRLIILWWTYFRDPPRGNTGMRIAEVPTLML